MQLNNRDIEWCQRRCNYDQCVFSLRSTQYRLQLGYLFNLQYYTICYVTLHTTSSQGNNVNQNKQALELQRLPLPTNLSAIFNPGCQTPPQKPFSSLSTRLAHAAHLGFFYKNALYKFTVFIIIIIITTTIIICQSMGYDSGSF